MLLPQNFFIIETVNLRLKSAQLIATSERHIQGNPRVRILQANGGPLLAAPMGSVALWL